MIDVSRIGERLAEEHDSTLSPFLAMSARYGHEKAAAGGYYDWWSKGQQTQQANTQTAQNLGSQQHANQQGQQPQVTTGTSGTPGAASAANSPGLTLGGSGGGVNLGPNSQPSPQPSPQAAPNQPAAAGSAPAQPAAGGSDKLTDAMAGFVNFQNKVMKDTYTQRRQEDRASGRTYRPGEGGFLDARTAVYDPNSPTADFDAAAAEGRRSPELQGARENAARVSMNRGIINTFAQSPQEAIGGLQSPDPGIRRMAMDALVNTHKMAPHRLAAAVRAQGGDISSPEVQDALKGYSGFSRLKSRVMTLGQRNDFIPEDYQGKGLTARAVGLGKDLAGKAVGAVPAVGGAALSGAQAVGRQAANLGRRGVGLAQSTVDKLKNIQAPRSENIRAELRNRRANLNAAGEALAGPGEAPTSTPRAIGSPPGSAPSQAVQRFRAARARRSRGRLRDSREQAQLAAQAAANEKAPPMGDEEAFSRMGEMLGGAQGDQAPPPAPQQPESQGEIRYTGANRPRSVNPAEVIWPTSDEAMRDILNSKGYISERDISGYQQAMARKNQPGSGVVFSNLASSGTSAVAPKQPTPQQQANTAAQTKTMPGI